MNDSLIEKKLSTGWKGILILLIVLGHCSLLCKYGPGDNEFYTWRSWIYSFHVWGFFILPFLYGSKLINGGYKKVLKKNFIKLYIPYTWISILCVLISLISGNNLNFVKVIEAWVVGSQWMTSSYIGFHFLWFLPTMFSVLLMRDLYFNLTLREKLIMVSCLLFLCISDMFGTNLGYLYYLPFNIVEATKYALVGIMCRNIIEYIETLTLNNRLIKKVIVHLVFIISTILFFIFDNLSTDSSLPKGVSLILNILLPTTFGCFIIWYQKLGNNRILQVFGKYSLQIYLFHVIVYNILLIISQRLASQTFLLGIVVYALTLLISLGLAILIKRIKPIHSILFP